jgi:hypothetical protein
MTEQERDKHFKLIATKVMKAYHHNMQEFLLGNSKGSLTEADVAVMIMNLSVGIGINIYYTIKQILPNAKMDFDFMKATMCNELIKGFEEIKDYNPPDYILALTKEQVQEAIDKGFVDVTHADGTVERVLKDSIVVTRETAEKLIQNEKKEAQDAAIANKIIKPRSDILRGRYN